MFSVIIPTYNRAQQLEVMLRCVHAAIAQISQPIQVIVTSDSHDRASDLVTQKFGYQFVCGPQRGPAANRNFGAQHAQYPWLIFLDDDCLPDTGIFKAYRQAIQDYPTQRVLEGAIHATNCENRWNIEIVENTKGGYLWSCNFAIQRDLFAQVGGFDSTFPMAASEDADLFNRLKVYTSEYKFIPDAFVSHPARYLSLQQNIRRYKNIRWSILAEIKRTKRSLLSGLITQILYPINQFRCLKVTVKNLPRDKYPLHRFINIFISILGYPIFVIYFCWCEVTLRKVIRHV